MLVSKRFFILLFTLTALLLLVLASSALAESTPIHNPQVTKQLDDLKRSAFELRKEADTLRSMLPNKLTSWQSHTNRLNALRDHVNEMGRSLADLETGRAAAGERQAMAMEQTRFHLVPMAQNLTQAIALINENRDSVLWGEYRDAVSDVYTHANALHTTLDAITNFEEAKVRLDGLKLQTALPADD
jgi:septal ring factor EnvC (AmiA/AmiB activator)